MHYYTIKLLLFMILSTITQASEGLYRSKCLSCHKGDGSGSVANKAPKIAGQYAWYLEAQIKDIRDGKRKNGNSNRMVPFVRGLTDEEIKSISKYVEGL